MITRRLFLKQAGLSAVAFGSVPSFLSRALAEVPAGGNRVLVVIIQRGAMDGLSLVPPLEDPRYREARPNIALEAGGESPAIRLGGGFWLHPSALALKRFWDEGTLAFVHQAGSPDPSRSHFDAQDFFESGTPGLKNTQDGFLNRALQHLAGNVGPNPLRAVALQPSMPRILWGSYPAVSMESLRDYAIKTSPSDKDEAQGFEAMYEQAADKVFRGVGHEVFDSLQAVRGVASDKDGDGGYPKAQIGKRLREIAELIKGGVGLQIAVTDMGGWDTHVGQGNHKGQLADRLRELSEALAAFAQDLGPRFQDVCVLTATEFGRTFKENGTRGTDHGHGSVMMALGGRVQGRKILGRWKDLSPANLFEGRDLPVTTDHREVLAEALRKHLGLADLRAVFPGFDPGNGIGVLKG